jgi:hypothetical protein
MMASTDGQEPRYSYKYTFVQDRGAASTSEPSKTEVQAYINDVLGLGRLKVPLNESITV